MKRAVSLRFLTYDRSKARTEEWLSMDRCTASCVAMTAVIPICYEPFIGLNGLVSYLIPAPSLHQKGLAIRESGIPTHRRFTFRYKVSRGPALGGVRGVGNTPGRGLLTNQLFRYNGPSFPNILLVPRQRFLLGQAATAGVAGRETTAQIWIDLVPGSQRLIRKVELGFRPT
jgi:hypothetical protein